MAFASPVVIKNLKGALRLEEEFKPYFTKIDKKMEGLERSMKENQKTNEDKFSKLSERIQKLEERQLKSATMDNAAEEMAQEKWNLSLIFTGLKTTELKKEIIQLATDVLGVDIETSAITSIFKIPPKEPGKIIHKVQFRNQEERNEVYRKRTKLRDQADIFINEDLIPCRNNLAYEARQLAQHGDILQTWTFQGKVFIRPTSTTEDPIKIAVKGDLEKYRKKED